MYTWMENVNLSNFSGHIEDFINHLVDPASLIIPNDPVFVAYREPERLRVMSASSLNEIAKQMEESRQFIEKAPQDISCIAMVVASNDTDKPYEKASKEILRGLVEQGMSRAKIRITCTVLNVGAIQAFNVAKKDEPLSIKIIDDLKILLGRENAPLVPLVDDYLKILNSPEKPSGIKVLPEYLEELITQQMVELETHRKKLRDEDGDDLTTDEIICPLTRQVINIQQSLPTQAAANQFFMLIVVLAQLAKVKNNELDEFIASQDNDYVNECFEMLQHYVQNPKQTLLTEEQHELLNQLGMSIVLQQWQAEEEETLSQDDAMQKMLLSFPQNIKKDSSDKPEYSKGQSSRFFKLHLEEKDETDPTYNKRVRRNSI